MENRITKKEAFKILWSPKANREEKGGAVSQRPGVATMTRTIQALIPGILIGIAILALALGFHGAWHWVTHNMSAAAQFVRYGIPALTLLGMIGIGAGTHIRHKNNKLQYDWYRKIDKLHEDLQSQGIIFLQNFDFNNIEEGYTKTNKKAFELVNFLNNPKGEIVQINVEANKKNENFTVKSSHTIEVGLDETVEEFKIRIAAKEGRLSSGFNNGIRPKYRLAYGNKVLKNERTLASYNINNLTGLRLIENNKEKN